LVPSGKLIVIFPLNGIPSSVVTLIGIVISVPGLVVIFPTVI
jgi:hypothetical protein